MEAFKPNIGRISKLPMVFRGLADWITHLLYAVMIMPTDIFSERMFGVDLSFWTVCLFAEYQVRVRFSFIDRSRH